MDGGVGDRARAEQGGHGGTAIAALRISDVRAGRVE